MGADPRGLRRLLLSPAPWDFVAGRNLRAYRRDPTGFLSRAAREQGDVAHIGFGSLKVVLLSHPDDIRDVLVTQQRSFAKGLALQRAKRLVGEGLLTSEGEFHRRQRRLVQPAFHRERIAGYGETMVAYAEQACGRWRDGAELDVAREMRRLTLAIVAKTLFDADVEEEADEVGAAMTEALGMFEPPSLPFAGLSVWLSLPPGPRFRRARARLNATVYRMIERRRAGGEDRGDLLSMLLIARDEEGDGGGMTDTQVRDEVMTLILAGHETTANALTWTWYLLSEHPQVEARLHAELDGVLGGRLPTTADVGRLPYAQGVVAEALRLYPPVWVLGRRALEDVEIGGSLIAKGSLVVMGQWIVHRDPRWWPEPLRFEPQRWAPEVAAGRPRFAYFPFGGGARTCIGESFSWVEGTLLLAALAQRWRFRLRPGHTVQLQPQITLRPKRGMPMTLERRA